MRCSTGSPVDCERAHRSRTRTTRFLPQGICFLGKLKFDDFLRHYLGESPGIVVDRETGEAIGEHRGLWFHTIGQRRGIGPVLKQGNVHRGPWYVSAKDIAGNVLEVTNKLECIDGPRASFQVHYGRVDNSGQSPRAPGTTAGLGIDSAPRLI